MRIIHLSVQNNTCPDEVKNVSSIRCNSSLNITNIVQAFLATPCEPSKHLIRTIFENPTISGVDFMLSDNSAVILSLRIERSARAVLNPKTNTGNCIEDAFHRTNSISYLKAIYDDGTHRILESSTSTDI